MSNRIEILLDEHTWLGLTAFLGFLAVFGRYAARAIKATTKAYKSTTESVELLHLVAAEMRPNGGGSLKDVVNRIEERVEGNSLRMLALVNSITDVALFEADPKGLVFYVSEGFKTLTGVEFDDSLRNGWLVAVHSDDRPRVWAEWTAAITQQREFSIVCRIQHLKNQKVTEVSLRALVVRSTDGSPISFVGSVRLSL